MIVYEEQKDYLNNNLFSNKKIMIILSATIYIGLFVFFYFAHPMYIYDSDDWTYISYARQGLPDVNQWNPTKVLPETLMPLISEIGVRFVYPLMQDYIQSLAFSYAATISFIITIYIICILHLIKYYFNISGYTLMLMGGLIALYHFWPFSVDELHNRFVFYGGNVNCYFNYIIPGLFNAICVLIFMCLDMKKKKIFEKNMLACGFLILLVYLCINSNMFHSIILVSYIGIQVLEDFINRYHISNNRKFLSCLWETIKNNKINIAIMVTWLVSIIIESQGARAKWAAGTTLRNLPVIHCAKLFIISVKSLNKICIVASLSIIFAAIAVFIVQKNNRKEIDLKYIKVIAKMILAEFVTIVYLILLCAKVTPEYIQNNTVMISWIVWIVLVTVFSLGYLTYKLDYVKLLLPILLYLLIFNTVIDGKTYADNNVVWNYGVENVKKIDEYIIFQIQDADKKGLDYAEILVPVTDSNYWPLDVSYAGDRIAASLFRHDIIRHKMHVVITPDMTVNEKFNIGTATIP